VILINHENRLHVDTACANLAIKFNMLYVSVFQLIKEHIDKQTPIGKALAKSYQTRDLKDVSSVKVMDKDSLARQEFEFSAVHYDLPIVIQLIKETIMAKRTTQQFILLEGLCNSTKLSRESDRLELRQMDEFFALEKSIGEVNSVISLISEPEITQIPES
jgi:hypothetical protein